MNIQHDTLADYRYTYSPGTSDSKRVILLLHGTGGNEDDLLGLGAQLDSKAHLLSPRGNVLENGMPRFFRRFGEGQFDAEDVIRRSKELVEFLRQAIKKYSLDGCEIVVLGYSNGANIASAMLLLHPGSIHRAILLRPMLTIVPQKKISSPSTRVVLLSGKNDPIVPHESVNALTDQLTLTGMEVTHIWQEAGHQLTRDDLLKMQTWLRSRL